MTGRTSSALASLALAWAAAVTAAPPPEPATASAPSSAPQPVAASAATHLRFRMTSALLKMALARDEGLGNALAQFAHQGIELSPPSAGRKGRLVFVPRTAQALAAFIDDPSKPFPRAPDSATPAATSGAVYWLEPTAEGGSRLVVGLDDAAQAAQTTTAASRWFEVTIVSAGEELTALAWRALPAP